MPPTIGLGKAVMPKTVRRRTTDSLACGGAGWRPALRAPRGETGVEYTPAGRDTTQPIVFLVARLSQGWGAVRRSRAGGRAGEAAPGGSGSDSLMIDSYPGVA